MKDHNRLTAVIDVGTSSARVALVESGGKIVWFWQEKHGLYILDEKTVLQDPEEIMLHIWKMLEKAAEWTTENHFTLECISVTGQRSSVIPMKRDGSILEKAISWRDTRAYDICLEYKAQLEEIYNIAGIRLSPVFSAPKMVLLKRTMPKIYEDAYKLAGFQEYVIKNLTGRFVTDVTIASRTALLDIRTLQWSERLLHLFDIDSEKLCRLIPAGEMASDAVSRIKSLFRTQSAIPVLSAGGDQQCAALGLGCLRKGDTEMNSGTGAYIATVCDSPVLDSKMRVNCNAFSIPGKWIVEGTVLSAGKAVEWLNREIFGAGTEDMKEFMKACEKAPAGANGVVAATTFMGSGTPQWNAKAKAAFLGIGFGNTKSDFPRALLEGIAAELLECLETMEDLTGQRPEVIRAAGGMTANSVYCQILADMFSRKICRPQICEATVMGAWITAQMFLGNVKTYESAYEMFGRREGKYYVPNKENQQIYREGSRLRAHYMEYFKKR